MQDNKTAESRYQELTVERQHVLDTARRCAELTIPTLLPPEGWTGNRRLPQPYSGFGARAITNLASRLLLALLPAGQPFFKLGIPAKTLVASGELEEPEELKKQFAQAEQLIMSEVEGSGWRQPTNMTLQLLATTGNAVEYLGPDNKIRVFRIDQYVVSRDPAGRVVEFILKQSQRLSLLPENIQEVAGKQGTKGDDTVDVYTRVLKVSEDIYRWYQEVKGVEVPNSSGVGPKMPFDVLRWNAVPGEHYGRGKAEEHMADLEAVEVLTKSMLEGSAMASFHILLVNENASSNRLRRQLEKAQNGSILTGKEGDITAVQYDNVAGLQIAQAELQRILQELSRSFLMMSSLQRDAERVTATELRIMAEELEGALGGVYSMLSEEMQRSRISRLIMRMQETGDLPAWSQDQVTPTITTGLEALGRERDALNTIQALQAIGSIGLPQEEFDRLDTGGAMDRILTGFNVPGLVRSDQEVQQIREERMMQQMAAQASMQPQAPQPQ